MRNTRRISPIAAATLAVLLASCDAATRPETEGTLRPIVTFVRDSGALPPAFAQPLTSMLLTVSGPTSKSVELTKNGNLWQGSATGLAKGTYTVSVTGIISGGSVQHYGVSNPVEVVPGKTASASVPLALMASELTPPSVTNTTDFAVQMTFATVAAASGYQLQASQSSDFSGTPITQNSTGTSPVVTVPLNATGTWFIRGRALLPAGVSGQTAFGPAFSITVDAATGGRTSALPNSAGLAIGTTTTVTERNITATETEDWHSLPNVRAGDSIFIDAVANGLTAPTPVSQLNTFLELFRTDDTDLIASSGTGGVGNDARLVLEAPSNATYLARVTATNNTVGHYNLVYRVTRLPATPTGFTAVAASNASIALSWTDNASVANSDQEAGYEIWRCQGAGCSDFALLTTTAADATTHTDVGLTTGASYTYRIRARLDATHNSPFVGPLEVSLIGPDAPTGFTATTFSGTRIDLAWTDASDNESSFIVTHCAGAGCSDFTVLATLPANTEAYQHTVSLDETHTYQLQAMNAVVGSALVGPVTANTVRPAAPSGLIATTQGPTSIKLDWTDNATNPDNETGFRIERCSGAGCTTGFTEIQTVGPNVVTFTDATVAFDNSYGYRVRAYNTPGASAYTNVANADTRAPGAPANFTATIFSATRVDLAWSDTTAAETGFKIERCEGIGCSGFSDLHTTAAGATSYSDNTVTIGNVYAYRLTALGVAGNSSESGPVIAPILLPASPTGLTAQTISATQVNLAWTDASVNETGFSIERCLGAGCSFVGELVLVPAGTSAYSDLTVTEGNEYSYRVRAVNAVGNSAAYTNVATISTALPAAPTGLTATTINTTRIDLQWTDLAADEDGFRIERCTGLGCSDFTLFTTVAADVTSFQNTVAAGEYFAYRVLAYNDAGPSAPTNTATASTIAPPDPTGLVATTINATQIDLSWTDVATNESAYHLERCAGDGCGGAQFSVIASLGVNTSDYSDATVTPGESYTYRVRAENVIGLSGYSNTSTATTRVPGVPANVVAVTISGTQIDLAWTDTLSTEQGFAVFRCAGPGCVDFAFVGNTGTNATQYSDLTVVLDQQYRYYVEAFNASGGSDPDEIVEASTMRPASATGLTATTNSPTSITVSWNDITAIETGWVVERCVGVGCSDFVVVANLPVDAVSYVDDAAVAADNSYSYIVYATGVAGNSDDAGPVTALTFVPPAPTSLVATTASGTQVDLTWVDNATDEVSYEIERCAGDGCSDFVNVATVGADQQAYSDMGLATGVAFSYRVRAVNGSGPSAYSNEATATTNLPANPTALVAQIVDASQVQLTWADNSAPPTEETGFEIERCEGAGCAAFALVNTTSPNVAGSTDAVVVGTTYRYRVRAINTVGASGYTNEVQITILAPNTPLALSAIGTSPTTIALVWSDDSDNEATIEIERCAGAACSDFGLVATIAAADSTQYVDTGLTPESDYRYRVRALNAVGASGFSVEAAAHTKLPLAPTTLDAAATSSTVVGLTWVDNATDETSYAVERCEGAACTDFVQVASLVLNSTSYSDAGLTPNSLYRYRVRAISSVGGGAYSNIDDAPTDIPIDPSGLAAVAMSFTEIALDWQDESNNETGFIIERCQGVGCGDFAVIQLVGANVNSYSDPTVLADQSYSYRVQAVKTGSGASGFSNTASAVTSVPGDPVNLFATTVTGSQIALTWDDDAVNELNMEVERCTGDGCSDFSTLVTLPANTTSYADNAVALNTTYRYRVRATNNVGPSSYTNEVTANTLQPAITSGLSATTISATQVDLSWVDGSTNETHFLLERCTGAGCVDFARLDSLGAGTITFQDLTVTLGNIYRYRVGAFNNSGTAGYDGPVEASTLLPTTPTDLAATVINSGRIDLSWSDTSDNEDGFRVERCSGIGCASFVELTTLPAGTTAYSSTGLAGNTFYTFRIRAYNAAGPSAYTAPVDANTFLPAAPSALTATTVLADRIDLTWNDNSNNEVSFGIERCTGVGCVSFAPLVTVGADVESYSDLTTILGQQYGYRVRSVNGVGPSGYATATASTADVPTAPSALTAEATSTTSIQLNWQDDSANELRFRIERCAGAGCSDFAPHDSVGAGIVSFDDVGLSNDQSYSYRVRAVNNGASTPTNTATATTFLPAAASGLTATGVSSTRADLAWTDNADNEYGFEIERCTGAGCTDFAPLTTVGADVTSYSDLTLAQSTSYTYRVRAYNGAGAAAYSNEAAATTNVPDIPTGLAANTVSNTQIDLSWTDNATGETGYEIERCAGVGCTDFALAQTVAADATSHQDTGLPNGTVFRYRVRAINASGGSGYSNVVTSGTNVPAAPSDLVPTTITDSQVDLTWTDNADNELGYVVERCTGVGCSGHTQIATLPADATFYSDNTVTPGNDYVYRVYAQNNAGVSDFSNPGDAQTRTPAAPTGLTATTISATQIDLTWADNSDNEQTFRVRRCAGVACSPSDEIASLPPGSTGYSDLGLTPNESYSYIVEANNVSGWSGVSNEATATTNIPADPSNLVATTQSATSIQLDWTDNSNNELRFVVFRCDNAGCLSETFVEVDSVAADVTTFTDLSLTFGNSYAYRVVARNAAGTSNFIQAAATTLAPADPTDFVATVIGDTQIDLAWTDNADNEAGVEVERCTGAGCSDFALLTTTAADATGYSDASAVLGTVYRYRIRAVNAAGTSSYSAEDEEGTVVPNGAVPTLTVSVLSETQASLTWGDNADNEAGYRIERCLGAACVDFAEIGTTGANATEFQVADLAVDNQYRFRIRAFNVIGNASYSNEAYASTFLPVAPTGLTATTVASGQIDLAWTDNADNEVTYRVERCQGIGCASFVEIATVTANSISYENTGVSLNGVYRYRVRALNAIGPSGYSNEDQANTLLPSAPTNLVATPVHGERIDLSWTDSNLEQGYQLEACSGFGCSDFTVIQAIPADQTALQLAVNFGNDYTFRLRAVNISGPSPYSNTADGSTVLAAPTLVRASTSGRTSITVTWQDNSTIETAYRIERCTGAGCGAPDFFQLLPPNTTSFADDPLSPNGTFYTYRVRAITTGGNVLSTTGSAAMTPVVVTAPMTALVASDTSRSERHWVVSVPPGARQLVLKQLTGTGDPDVYLKYGSVPVAFDISGAVSTNSSPTGTDSVYCVPYTGANPEYCVVNNPTPGDWFIMSQGFSAYSGLQVEISIPGDVVVINDLNVLFSNIGLTDNAQFARNLAQITPGVGPRTSNTAAYIDMGRASYAPTIVHADLANTLAGIGHTLTIINSTSGTLPSVVPADAKLLFLYIPATAFEQSEIDFLRTFLREGGRIVIIGEAASITNPTATATINQLLAAFGSSTIHDGVTSESSAGIMNELDVLTSGLFVTQSFHGGLIMGPWDKSLAIGGIAFRTWLALISPRWTW